MPVAALTFRLRHAFAAILSASLLLLTACGGAGGSEPRESATGAAVTVENCGVTTTYDRPPERVVGYYQHPTELLLALGLRDKIVGTAYPDNEPVPEYRDDYARIPAISKQDASFEQVLKTSPDLVYGGYGTAFDKTAGRSRKAFADAGIDTYLNRENCSDDPTVMSDVYAEVRTVGRIFRVGDRADAVVADMRSSVDRTRDRLGDVDPVDVFVYDSGTSAPFTAGGKGIGNQVIELAGGRNVFADVDSLFADVSWEQVLQRNPDVIVIYDYFGTPSVEQKKRFLLSRPELADVPAIKHERFAVLTLQDAVLGVRAPYAVESLARQLHPERMS